jgi:ribosomal 50S subunit-recycling heat shock protein
MRLDKFLKVSRIIKRRTIAKEIADQNRVIVNGRPAKSSTKVTIGDKIELVFGNKTLVVQVEDLRDTTKKAESEGMFTVIEERFDDNE